MFYLIITIILSILGKICLFFNVQASKILQNMQHVTSFTMFDSYDVALFTLQTRDFEKIQDGPQCVKWCINYNDSRQPC